MIFLPIVERELRLAARRRSTYWARLAAAVVAILISMWVLGTMRDFGRASANGAGLFHTLSWFALIYFLLAGLRVTADCLSEEKREGTLGLLFLTDLKGYDVVFGKLAATSLDAFYGMLAMLPVLAVPILMGGVTLDEFLRVTLVLANSLFFSLATGIFVSSISREGRQAYGGASLVLLVVTAGLPLLGAILESYRVSWTAGGAIALFSPGYGLLLASGSRFGPASKMFWVSLGLTHVLSWISLVLASRIAASVWQERPASGVRQRWGNFWQRWKFGSSTTRKIYRRRLLEINPILWLSSRELQMRKYPWIFLSAMAAVFLWGVWLNKEMMRLEGILVFSYVVNFIFKCWVGTMAAESFSIDRDKGALELLLSTPLTVEEVLRGQWLTLKRQFAWPLVTVVLVELLLMIGSAKSEIGVNRLAILVMFGLMNIIVLVFDCFALGWVGLWAGLTTTKHNRAGFVALGRVLLIPSLVFFGLGFLMVPSLGQGSTFFLPLFWFLCSVMADGFLGVTAQSNLQLRLRTIATERFSVISPSETTPSWLKRFSPR